MFVRKELLETLGFSETDNPSNEELDARYNDLLKKDLSFRQEETLENAYVSLVEENESLKNKLHPPLRPTFSAPNKIIDTEQQAISEQESNQILIQTDSGIQADFSKDLNKQLRANLNGLTPNGRFIVGGSPQATIGIMARNTLLMRCRLGSLFRGGGACIELTLEGIEAMKPDELAQMVMTVINTCFPNAKEITLKFPQTSSYKVMESIRALSKTQGFKQEKPDMNSEEINENTDQKSRFTPFKLSPDPLQ